MEAFKSLLNKHFGYYLDYHKTNAVCKQEFEFDQASPLQQPK